MSENLYSRVYTVVDPSPVVDIVPKLLTNENIHIKLSDYVDANNKLTLNYSTIVDSTYNGRILVLLENNTGGTTGINVNAKNSFIEPELADAVNLPKDRSLGIIARYYNGVCTLTKNDFIQTEGFVPVKIVVRFVNETDQKIAASLAYSIEWLGEPVSIDATAINSVLEDIYASGYDLVSRDYDPNVLDVSFAGENIVINNVSDTYSGTAYINYLFRGQLILV